MPKNMFHVENLKFNMENIRIARFLLKTTKLTFL